MISVFLAIGIIFRGNIRAVQSGLEVLKTIIIAFAIKNLSNGRRITFCVACLLLSFILIPLHETIIYNIPSVIGGLVIGIQNKNTKRVINYGVYFFVNCLLIIYEFSVFNLLSHSNLFIMYFDQTTEMLVEFTNGNVSSSMIKAFFIGFMIFDSAFTSAIIFISSELVSSKLDLKKQSKNR